MPQRFSNLLWMSGNDFQVWRNPKDDEAALAVAKGIRESDPDHSEPFECEGMFDTRTPLRAP
jgi:hypothetical protein